MPKALMTRGLQEDALLLLEEIHTWLEHLPYKAPELIELNRLGLMWSIRRITTDAATS